MHVLEAGRRVGWLRRMTSGVPAGRAALPPLPAPTG